MKIASRLKHTLFVKRADFGEKWHVLLQTCHYPDIDTLAMEKLASGFDVKIQYAGCKSYFEVFA